MANLKFELSLSIPEDPAGTLIAGVKIQTALADRIPAIRNTIRYLKSYARKINEGKPNEEMAVRAQFHVCYQDEVP